MFKTNEAKLSPLSYTEVDKVVEYLKNNEQVSIVVLGHTDINGDENLNQILSKKLSRAVSDYFITKNIDKKRLNEVEFNGI